MDLNAVPTKGNLIAAKNSLALAKQGFELMDKKRNILVREIMDLNAKAKDIQDDIDTDENLRLKYRYLDYTALERANIELGIQNVEIFAFNVPLEHDVKIKSRSIMGTEIPLVTNNESVHNPVYSFYGTTESLDKAKTCFEKVKDLTIRLSMIENSAYRLAYNIKKTQKRANALKNITIPTYEGLVKTISNALEEKEREEFTRLKVIKARADAK